MLNLTKFLMALIIIVIFSFGLIWVAGSQLSSPAFSDIGLPPPEHISEDIVFEGVHGWYFPASEQKACILLMHGVRSNRKEMLSRAIFLKEEGYSSFTVDLQAHGETIGQHITYGYKESESARSALKFLKTEQHCQKVVAIGSSLGGAASLLGPTPISVDGYILEAVYPNVESAVENRLGIRLGSIGALLAPLFYQQIPLRLGIDLKHLSPLKAISNIKSPVLIMNGTKDKRTTIEEAALLYDSAPDPKEFVKVVGAAHVDLYNYNSKKYKEAVLSFLSRHID